MADLPSDRNIPQEDKSPQRRVTLRDIAEAVGVSHVSVSLALRNHPRISEALTKRVQETAQKMGYAPDPMLSALAHYRHGKAEKTIQAALAWFNLWPKSDQLRRYKEFDFYWRGAAQAALKFGYRLEEFAIGENMPPDRVEKILLSRGIKGILIPPGPSEFDWTKFDWKQFSTVVFGRTMKGIPQFHMVSSAQPENAALAFRAMRAKGYERIGFLGYQSSIWTFLGGFLQAQMVDLPSKVRIPPLLIDGEPLSTNGKEKKRDSKSDSKRLDSWIDKWKPDAVLTESKEGLQLLNDANSRRPEPKMGLAGLTVLDLPIDSGINQRPEEIGRVATLVLISLINDHDRGLADIPREILIKGSWVDGSSLPTKI